MPPCSDLEVHEAAVSVLRVVVRQSTGRGPALEVVDVVDRASEDGNTHSRRMSVERRCALGVLIDGRIGMQSNPLVRETR